MPLPRWGGQNYELQTPLPRAVGQRNTPPIFRSGNTAQVQKRAALPLFVAIFSCLYGCFFVPL